MRTRTAVLTLAAALGPIAHATIIAHWRLDDDAGSPVAADSTGNFHGVLAGDASFNPTGGIDGGCIELAEAGNGCIAMGPALPFSAAESFTVSAWVKLGEFATHQIPISKHTEGFANGYLLCINISPSYGAPHKPWFYDAHAGGAEALGATSVDDGAWHHIVGVRKAGELKRIYVDGKIEDVASLGTVEETIAPLLIGGVFAGGVAKGHFTGSIDDVQIYDEALTPTEIDRLFNNPGSIICRGDVNGSLGVNSADLNILLAQFGCTSSCTADVNGDNTVNSTDLNLLLENFGAVCEP